LAGAIQGITAALLWSAQGEVMVSYPLEKDKGKMFGIFWGAFSFYLQPDRQLLRFA
jgi:Ion channel regulatory protein UNC-93